MAFLKPSVTPSSMSKNMARSRMTPFAVSAIVFGILAGILVVVINQPTYVLLTLGGIIAFLLAVYFKEFGLIVLVFISYTRFSDILIEFHGAPSIAKLYFVLMVVSILIRWVIFHDQPKGWELPIILFVILILTEFASLIYSPVPDRVLTRLFDELKDMSIALMIVILLQDVSSLRKVIWTLILVGLFLGSLSTFQYFTKSFDNNFGGFAISGSYQIVGSIDNYRATGPMTDPNFFAEIMVALVPIAYERFLHEKNRLLRSLALGVFAISAFTILITYSRGGLLAMVIAMAIFLLIYPPHRIQIPFIIFAVVIFSTFLPSNYLDRLSLLPSFFTSGAQETSLQGRLSENVAAWEMIKANPLFGVGLNSFSYLFPQYSKDLGLALVATEREAHSMYLEVAAERGIIGFLVFAIVLFVSFRTVINATRIFSQNNLENYRGMGIGFLTGLTGYLVAAAFIQNAFPRFFYVLIGIALSFRRVAINASHDNPTKEWGLG